MALKELFSLLGGARSSKKRRNGKSKHRSKSNGKKKRTRKGGNVLRNALGTFSLLGLQKYTSNSIKSRKIKRRRYKNKLY